MKTALYSKSFFLFVLTVLSLCSILTNIANALPIEIDQFETTSAVIELIDPNGGIEIVNVAGPTTVHVIFEGKKEGDALDNNRDGLDEVVTEMVSLSLKGNSSRGPVLVRLNPDMPTVGGIAEQANNTSGTLDVPPFTSKGLADSFFDVFFEIVLPDGTVLHNQEPKRLSSVIRHKPPAEGDSYEGLKETQLFDANGKPSGFSLGAARHIPRPPVEIDQFETTTAIIELIDPNGGTELVNVAGPTTVHVFFEGQKEGDAFDNSGDGLDEVVTEMVSLSLKGNSSKGPVLVRLNPDMPTVGGIAEQANNTPGILDVPPFTSKGQADSFFDVFFEIVLPDGTVLHNREPKRLSSVIRHKPPAPGDQYEGLGKIPLYFANGEPSGFVLGAARHIPRTVDEIDRFETTSAVIELLAPDGSSEVVNVTGPTTVHVFFEGSQEGDAFDNDGDGQDEVETEMVALSLTGNSSMGPVLVRLNPAILFVGALT